MTNEELLDLLRIERLNPNLNLFNEYCNELITRGVYPALSQNGVPAAKMVECYGVNWHEFQEPLACPKCNADWRDHISGPPFKREFAHVFNDRLVGYSCPECMVETPV